MNWQTVAFFGLTHILVPSDTYTLCNAYSNSNNEVTTITSIKGNVTCDGCLKRARSLKIPTSM